ncbi:MAG: hypothetical protein D3924_17575, partial [Candidatus Electrothrix sp. AR4]|nr:hypothetical protein [Candidatus Electrothrix sp. AR4]
MPHFFSFDSQKKSKWIFGTFLFLTVISCLLLLSRPVFTADQKATPYKSTIEGMSARYSGNNLEITVHCKGKPKFQADPLHRPKRTTLVLEIENAEIRNPADLTLPKTFNMDVVSTPIKDVTPELISIEFTLPESYPFAKNLEEHLTTEQKENSIILTIKNFKGGEQVAQKEEDSAPDSASVPEAESETSGLSSDAPEAELDESKAAASVQPADAQAVAAERLY